jgi:hypothetical protein
MEIVIVAAVAMILLGIVTALLTQFRRSYTKGEESSIILQEGSLFLAILRSDFINAVRTEDLPEERWAEAIQASSDRLSFFIYKDAEGAIEPVEYAVQPPPNPDVGASLTRTQGGGRAKTLIDRHLASMTWGIETEVLPGVASQVRQLWLNLRVELGGQGKPGIQSKKLNFAAKLFPTRLNRQLNSL